MSTDDARIIRIFLDEALEGLQVVETSLVALERDPSTGDTISQVFRIVHTIKGNAGFVGFTKVETIAHAGEELLVRLRDGSLQVSSPIISALLQLVDALHAMLGSIAAVGNEGDDAHHPLVARLQALCAAPEAADLQREVAPAGAPADQPPAPADQPPAPADQPLAPADQPPAPAGASDDGGDGERSQSSIRVNVELLDDLMTQVGELVLVRNQLLRLLPGQVDPALNAASQKLSQIATELQTRVMKTRMQPIANVWGAFPRLVRDVATTLGKRVRLKMDGKDTELDRALIEAIKAPLTHAVRNAIDHGIETPERRVAAGKPAEGTLWLRAFHRSSQMQIEVVDDGAGIDPDRVRSRAVDSGVLSAEQAAALQGKEALDLLLLPGFSTAERVTEISGRGVGLDVVHANIEQIGGHVELQSDVGRGTTLRLTIPLTLAIMPALIVRSGDGYYAIPQVHIIEIVRLGPETVRQKIEYIYGAPVYRLRGQLLPLIAIAEQLEISQRGRLEEGSAAPSGVDIVVAQVEGSQFGLMVDRIEDNEEIVVKPLGRHLRQVPVFAGATILGDGKLALILDLPQVASRANLSIESGCRVFSELTPVDISGAEEQLLLVRTPDGGRMAIPLSAVDRLEWFPRSTVERAGGQSVVQYSGRILPLIEVSSLLEERRRRPRTNKIDAPHADQPLHTVVHGQGDDQVGLVVDRILDVVGEHAAIQRAGSRDGVLGALVIRDRVTEILDVDWVVSQRLGRANDATAAEQEDRS